MVALYITSLEKGTGKTAIAAGIGKHLLADKKSVGFFKPRIDENTTGSEKDAAFMKQVLNLSEPVDSLCPAINDGDNLAGRIEEAYTRISPGKDIVIIEGNYDRRVAEALEAKALFVESYPAELSEAMLSVYKALRGSLLGMIWNKVPKSQVKRVAGEIEPQFSKAGIDVLGVLPEDRTLFALTIGELAEHIQGKIINNADKTDELAETFMLGAMILDSGLGYYGRKANKAAIIRSERSDMQLAAMETSTRGLILVGDTAPLLQVVARAQEKNIPIVVARADSEEVVTSIEDALTKAPFNQEKKLPKLIEIMEWNFDFKALYKKLGLAAG